MTEKTGNTLEFIKKHKYEIIFCLLLLAQFIVYTVYVSGYKTIPSPVFGGDVFRDRGFVKNIVEGNPVWSDAFYLGEIQYYAYFVPAIEAGIVKLFNFDVDAVFIYASVVFILFAGIAWFLLGIEFFNDKKYALMLYIASVIYDWYNLKFQYVAVGIFMPLFLYFWIRYEKRGGMRDSVLAGLMLALASLSYGGVLIPLVVIYFGYMIFSFLIEFKRKEKFSEILNQSGKLILKYFKKYYLSTIVFATVMSTYFLPLLIKYHMKIVNNVPFWGDQAPRVLNFSWFMQYLQGLFLNYGNVLPFIISLICLAGLIDLFITKKTIQKKLLLWILIIDTALFLHHWLTIPLFNWYFWPSKMLITYYFMPFLFVLGVKLIITLLGKKNKNDEKHENEKKHEKNALSFTQSIIPWIAMTLLVILCITNFYSNKNSQWEQYGMTDNSYIMEFYKLSDFIDNNIPNNVTILSNDESGFMLSVLSGKKVMITRRTHASYYVDIDKRVADASVAMFGHDINLTKYILNKYNVQYFYMDQQFLQYPMRTRTEFKQYLMDNNISFAQTVDRYDIAVPTGSATVFPLLLIAPQNVTEEFQSLLTPAYYVQTGGQLIGILYKVNY